MGYSALAIFYHDDNQAVVCKECATDKEDSLFPVRIAYTWGEGEYCSICGGTIIETEDEETETMNTYKQEFTNDDRYRIAEKSLLSGMEGTNDECIADLLADIMHFCNHDGYDFAQLLITATDNFDAEQDFFRCRVCGKEIKIADRGICERCDQK